MNGSLFITPHNPDSSFDDINRVRQTLFELGLIDDDAGAGRYRCGPQFASLITFMGCSPHLVFEPPQPGSLDYCHARLQHFPQIQLMTGQQTAAPRCPACRLRIAEWKSRLAGWLERAENWRCPQCGTLSAPWQLDWRQSGGAGRLFIEITQIFPGEAVPVDRLMKSLADCTGEKWRYFYLFADSRP